MHWKPIAFLVFVGGLVFVTSAWRDIVILRSGQPLYATSGVDQTSFDENYQYMPLAIRCRPDNLFPADAYGGLKRSEFTSFPYLVIWLESVMYDLFGLNTSLFVFHTLFPVLTFFVLYFLLVSFFDSYLSTILAFGVWAFSARTDIGHFLHYLVRYSFNFWIPYSHSITTIRPLESNRFQSPGMSFFFFSLALLATVNCLWIQKNWPRKMIHHFFLGLAWGVQVFIYYPNLLVGAAYINTLVLMRFWKTPRQIPWRERYRSFVAINSGIFAGCAPAVYHALGFGKSQADSDLLLRAGAVVQQTHPTAIVFFDHFRELCFVFVPWVMVAMLSFRFRGQIINSVKRLLPLLLLLPICIVAANVASAFIPRLPQPDRALVRLGNYFVLLNALVLFDIAFDAVKKTRPRIRYGAFGMAVMLILFLSALKIKAQSQAAEAYVRYSSPETERISESLKVISHYAHRGDTVISADLGLDYSLPVQTAFNTMMVNGITSHLTNDEIILRLAILAKTLRWNKAFFVHYMNRWPDYLPPVVIFTFRGGKDIDSLMNRATFEEYGYTQVHHMDISELNKPPYLAQVAQAYDNTDLLSAITTYKISVIHAPALPKTLESLFRKVDGTADGNNVYALVLHENRY